MLVTVVALAKPREAPEHRQGITHEPGGLQDGGYAPTVIPGDGAVLVLVAFRGEDRWKLEDALYGRRSPRGRTAWVFVKKVLLVLDLMSVNLAHELYVHHCFSHPSLNFLNMHFGEIPILVEKRKGRARRRGNYPCGLLLSE